MRLLLTGWLAVILALTVVSGATAHDSRRLDRMSYDQLAREADKVIRNGGIYSHRWGDASRYLIDICYEMVERAFKPYGTQAWAAYIVRRESGCNPGAINSSSGTTGIAQIHPRYHTWINYTRVQRDMKYALWTFVRLSRGGANTGPWCLC